ncbi:MAG TPA: HWE histidine kinase domain-containing protein [Devosia sp.]
MTESTADDRLRIATRAAHIGVWEWNLADNSMIYSDIARDICGFQRSGPVTYEMVRAVTHPDDFPLTSAAAKRALDPAMRENVVYNYRLIRADTGEQRYVVAHGEAIFGERDGVPVALRYVGAIQDVTELRRAEKRLVENEARLRLAIDLGGLAVWEVDLDRDTVIGSPELNRLCGFPPDASPSIEEFRARYAPGERERLEAEGVATTARGETKLQSEFRYIWPDGSEHWLRLQAQHVPGAAGSKGRAIGVLMDVTERKRREEQLELVSGELRHRIKNSLTVIGALARQAIASKGSRAAGDEFMDRLAAIGRATDLVFSSSSEAIAVEALLGRVLDPFRAGGRIELAGSDAEVPGDYASKVALAFHELCTNAVKYGALSTASGWVDVAWAQRNGELKLVWQERGGPPVTQPTTPGFGTRLLTRGLFAPPDEVKIDYTAGGVRCEITLTLR